MTLSIIRNMFTRYKIIFTLYFLTAILLSFMSLLSLWATKEVTNSIVSYVAQSGSWSELNNCATFIGVQLVIQVFQFAIDQYSSLYFVPILSSVATIKGLQRLLKVIWSADPWMLEETTNFSKLTASEQSIHMYLPRIVTGTFSLVKGIFGLIVYAFVLAHVSLYVAAIALIICIPSFIKTLVYPKQEISLLNDLSVKQRQATGLFSLLGTKRVLMDVWVFNFGKYLFEKWAMLYEECTHQSAKLGARQSAVSILVEILCNILSATSMILILWKAKSSGLSVGADVALLQVLTGVQQELQLILASVSTFYSVKLVMREINGPKIGPCATIMGREQSASPQENKVISLINVSYKYPSRSDYQLRQVSLDVYDGETLVIVGANGSGKTTLVKCMLGQCLPSTGSVQLYLQKQADRLAMATVWQDFVIYPLTVTENISLGNIHIPVDPIKIGSLLKQMGIYESVSRMPRKLDTLIDSTLVGGSTLSFGELQKIAICRALYANPGILILDEPTASLDPLSERDIYERVLTATGNRTTIMITHRLSICPKADRVVLIDKGVIVDVGTHSDLLIRCEEYRKLNFDQNYMHA